MSKRNLNTFFHRKLCYYTSDMIILHSDSPNVGIIVRHSHNVGIIDTRIIVSVPAQRADASSSAGSTCRRPHHRPPAQRADARIIVSGLNVPTLASSPASSTAGSTSRRSHHRPHHRIITTSNCTFLQQAHSIVLASSEKR